MKLTFNLTEEQFERLVESFNWLNHCPGDIFVSRALDINKDIQHGEICEKINDCEKCWRSELAKLKVGE